MKKFFGFFSRLFGKNPKRKGRMLALGFLATQKVDDVEKLRRIRQDLDTFLSSGNSLTVEAVRRVSASIARKNDLNPLIVSMFLSTVIDGLEEQTGDTNARLFLEGVADAFSLVA